MKYLVLNGVDIKDVKVKNNENQSALVLASSRGHFEIVKYVFEHCAYLPSDLNQAVLSASERFHHEIVKYLAENCSDLNALDDKARMGLQLATNVNNVAMDRKLTRCGRLFFG